MIDETGVRKLKGSDVLKGMREESEIEALLKAKSSNGESYFYYETLNNLRDLYTLGTGDSNSEDTIIVLQGPISDLSFLPTFSYLPYGL